MLHVNVFKLQAINSIASTVHKDSCIDLIRTIQLSLIDNIHMYDVYCIVHVYVFQFLFSLLKVILYIADT